MLRKNDLIEIEGIRAIVQNDQQVGEATYKVFAMICDGRRTGEIITVNHAKVIGRCLFTTQSAWHEGLI